MLLGGKMSTNKYRFFILAIAINW